MISSLFDRYKHFRRNGVAVDQPGADLALNQTYLQLHQAQRQRSFIEVKVKGDDVVYQSIILALDPEEQTILIDELFPTGFVGMAGQRVSISIRQKAGRKLAFDSVIKEQYKDDGTPIYVLAMPKDMERDQRRSAYRLPISRTMNIESHFTGPDQQRYLAKLRNVSSTGISIEVEAEDAAEFHYNDQLTEVAFDFAGTNIDCELAVRNVEVTESDHPRVLIGAEFIDLPYLEKNGLEKSIMRIQRDRLKYAGSMESQMAVV